MTEWEENIDRYGKRPWDWRRHFEEMKKRENEGWLLLQRGCPKCGKPVVSTEAATKFDIDMDKICLCEK